MKHVENISMALIFTLASALGGADSNNDFTFIISKIIALMLFFVFAIWALEKEKENG